MTKKQRLEFVTVKKEGVMTSEQRKILREGYFDVMTSEQRKILREGYFKIDMSYNNESGLCRDRLVKWEGKYYVINMVNGVVTEFIKL